MKWIVLIIILFVSLHTWTMMNHRKEEDPNLPYEESRERGGHALREVGWQPFPNAFAMDPSDRRPVPTLDPVEVESVPFDDPSVAQWSALIPDLSQGEEARRIEGSATIAGGQPYAARIVWEKPDPWRAPQMLFFRRDNTVLIVPRAPARGRDRSVDETWIVIPPEFLENGTYEILLVTASQLNRWTFTVE